MAEGELWLCKKYHENIVRWDQPAKRQLQSAPAE